MRLSLRSLLLLMLGVASGVGLWYRWNPYPEVMVLRGHARYVEDARFLSGNRIVSLDQGTMSEHKNTIRIWDAGRGALLCEMRGGLGDGVLGDIGTGGELTVSPKQRWLHLASHRDILHSEVVWHTDTGQELQLLQKNCPVVMTISPDDRYFYFYTYGDYSKLSIFDSITNKITLSRIHEKEVACCGFMADGKTLIFLTDDGTICFWDGKLCKETIDTRLSPAEAESFKFLRVSPDGQTLVVGAWVGKSIKIIDRKSGTVRFEAVGHPACSSWRNLQVLPLTGNFSPNGMRFYTLDSEKHEAYVWDLERGLKRFTFRWDVSLYPKHFAFSADGREFIISEGQRANGVWSLETGMPRPVDAWHDTRAVLPWLFSDDGMRMLDIRRRDGSLRVCQFRRPEVWWGIAWLPESWMAVLFVVTLVVSLRRDLRVSN